MIEEEGETEMEENNHENKEDCVQNQNDIEIELTGNKDHREQPYKQESTESQSTDHTELDKQGLLSKNEDQFEEALKNIASTEEVKNTESGEQDSSNDSEDHFVDA